jgi:hypothetical protein
MMRWLVCMWQGWFGFRYLFSEHKSWWLGKVSGVGTEADASWLYEVVFR